MSRNRSTIAVLTAGLLLGGCASDGTDRPTLAEFDANLNQGRTLSRLLGLDKLDQDDDTQREGLFDRLGVVFTVPSPTLEHRLQAALADAAPAQALTAVGPGAVRDALATAGCKAQQAKACLPKLAVYPGVRLLAVVDVAESGGIIAQITLLDTLLDTAYPAVQLTLPTGNGQPSQSAAEALAEGILLGAAEKVRLAPWTAYAFSRDGERWHVNAGERSGLAAGDMLEIRAGGKIIRAPSGLAAAWTPGPLKGLLRIEQLVGEDVAIAVLIDGEPPAATDPLLMAGQ